MTVDTMDGVKKNGSVGQPPRAKSTNSKPSMPQTRTFQPKVKTKSNNNGMIKTQSDTSIVNGLKNLSLNSAGSRTSSASSRKSNGSRGCQTVEDIARHILTKRARNVVVMAGAGISTPSGIPDFRTPGTGLYDNLKQYKIPYPQAIFDIDYFERNPKAFFTLAKELYPAENYRPNYVHYFLRLLYEKGLLLRIYTQNIDGLERMAGIPSEKLVEAHGSFFTASCIRCKQSHAPADVKGLVKPDIVFFGEDLPKRFYYYLRDFPQADLLIVMGTSLEVEPFAGIVDSTRLYVPRILFNREAVGPFDRKRRMNDVVAEGDIVKSVQKMVRVLGWKKQLDDLINTCEESSSESEDKEGEEEETKNSQNGEKDSTDSGSHSIPESNQSVSGGASVSETELIKSETVTTEQIRSKVKDAADAVEAWRKSIRTTKSPSTGSLAGTTGKTAVKPPQAGTNTQTVKPGKEKKSSPEGTTRTHGKTSPKTSTSNPPKGGAPRNMPKVPSRLLPVGIHRPTRRFQSVSAKATVDTTMTSVRKLDPKSGSSSSSDNSSTLPKIAYRHRIEPLQPLRRVQATTGQSSSSEDSGSEGSSSEDD